jgi:hypothetical protein
MEETRNKMPIFAERFFKKLSNYLDTKIYFYGSVQRIDYFPNSSDIDVDIFTDNENSTISKLQHFLGLKRYEFRKFVYRLHKTQKVVYGYKINYEDKKNKFSTEISIYNEKDKLAVLEEHLLKTSLPFYISILLFILKFFYYQIPIIPTRTYYVFKKLIMNYMVEGEDTEFIMTEVPYTKKK